MEGSSDSGSGWQNSDSFRGLNRSTVWNRNPRLIRASGSNLSEFTSHAPQKTDHRDKPRDGSSSALLEEGCGADRSFPAIEWGDVSLRQWLDKPERLVEVVECMHIFRQIVEIVNVAHSQGINVHNVRPSCFVMSSFNHVSFIESASCSDSGSDSCEEGLNGQSGKMKGSSATSLPDLNLLAPMASSRMTSEITCMLSGSVNVSRVPSTDGDKDQIKNFTHAEQEEERKQSFPMKQILLMETTWYTSPEEVSGASSSCASDIYQLGVLLFELFCPSISREEKSRTMLSLRHRVLPPQLLLKWPKEASFCLWLLHPDPSSRPKLGELLQSEFFNHARVDLKEREAAIEITEKVEEQDLVLEFLLTAQKRKQAAAEKLQGIISLLSFDIDEVSKLQRSLKQKGGSCSKAGKDDLSESDLPSIKIFETDCSSSVASKKRVRPSTQICNTAEYKHSSDGDCKSDTHADNEDEKVLSRKSRVMKNFKKLEEAYFLTRRRSIKPPVKPSAPRHSSISSDGKGSVGVSERSSVVNIALCYLDSDIATKDQYNENRRNGWVSPFLEGLCKYLSVSKLKVKADLKQGDLLNSSNLVCSLSFDRDGEFFATAGVNKKIKVFECDAILNEDRDVHYPVVEMASRSRLSCICWNSYIKSQIASSNFEGVVQLWDVTRNQVLQEMREHEKRVWSIDYSSADPTMLVSGSDDCSVKLWSINQGASVGTIRAKANVCCVQFPTDSSRYLAFGSADHKVYYYDLRNTKLPLCTMIGHNRSVSYVKFVDSMNIVSSSTDNTIKLWDLSTCTSRVLDCPRQSFTGHTNVKNFVGLSVSEGYIATGSETNEVFVYHKAFPMPAMSYKFNTMDPLSGQEMDDAAQFISSVCWRGQSSTLVAANSTGNVKILEMA